MTAHYEELKFWVMIAIIAFNAGVFWAKGKKIDSVCRDLKDYIGFNNDRVTKVEVDVARIDTRCRTVLEREGH